MTLEQFLTFIYTEPGRAALGAIAFAVTLWATAYIARKMGVPDLHNDDKRVISVAVVVIFSVILNLLAIAGGYAENSVEGWFTVISQIFLVSFSLFTATKYIDNSTERKRSYRLMRVGVAAKTDGS
jgi:O-antigen/teichoic acid export membrane protein